MSTVVHTLRLPVAVALLIALFLLLAAPVWGGEGVGNGSVAPVQEQQEEKERGGHGDMPCEYSSRSDQAYHGGWGVDSSRRASVGLGSTD